jgi:pre-mRNA-splicing factor SPF27
MPLIHSAVVALPHIDTIPLTPSQLQSANDLVLADQLASGIDTSALHPSIPSTTESQFSPLITAAHARLASDPTNTPRSSSALDLTRYEALDAPSPSSSSEIWTTALNRAATSAQYLRARETNLGLLEAYGKNAWLVGNARLEDELKALEKEVADKSMEKEDVARERREAEMGVAAEMQTLEETWKVGVGRMLEAQAAAEGLRLEILERKREGKVV